MQVSCMTKTVKNMQNHSEQVIDTRAAAHIVDTVGNARAVLTIKRKSKVGLPFNDLYVEYKRNYRNFAVQQRGDARARAHADTVCVCTMCHMIITT